MQACEPARAAKDTADPTVRSAGLEYLPQAGSACFARCFIQCPEHETSIYPATCWFAAPLGRRRTGQETGVGAQFDIGDAGRHSHQPSEAAMDRPKRRRATRRNKYWLRSQSDRSQRGTADGNIAPGPASTPSRRPGRAPPSRTRTPPRRHQHNRAARRRVVPATVTYTPGSSLLARAHCASLREQCYETYLRRQVIRLAQSTRKGTRQNDAGLDTPVGVSSSPPEFDSQHVDRRQEDQANHRYDGGHARAAIVGTFSR